MFTSFITEVFDHSVSSWLKIKESILFIEQEGFEVEPFTADMLENDFLDLKNVVVLLKKNDSQEVIGFTYAKPMEPQTQDSPAGLGETACILDTVIKKEFRGIGLLGTMMETLEEQLRMRGFKYLERNAMVANGFAESIQKHYKDGIIKRFPQESKWGPQVFFRIKL